MSAEVAAESLKRPASPIAGEETDAKKFSGGRVKGVASIKPEYLVPVTSGEDTRAASYDDDEPVPEALAAQMPGKKKQRGQNKGRKLMQKRSGLRFCDKSTCKYGDECRFEHDLDKFLEAKPADLPGVCPVYEAIGWCPSGLKCRWLGSHFLNREVQGLAEQPEHERELNRLSDNDQFRLSRKQYDFTKSDAVVKQLDQSGEDKGDEKAAFVEGVLKASEKKYIDYRGAKVLSPLTTTGNLPFRRLMKKLGADITFSEMAMGLPLVQGNRSEWALAREAPEEKDRFVMQLAASRPWQAIKAAQAVTEMAPGVSELNLNCGCPIDLLYRQGAGSALLDSPGKLVKILKGMGTVSDLPVSVKIRMGTKDAKPVAKSLVKRILDEEIVGCITLHGRSRQQRYSREADWEYIREVADIVREERETKAVKPWIVGNGDVYSYEDWYDHLENSHVDTCMVARGALVKPWIFEEIDSKQYLDKSATERLEYVKQYADYGLAHWGSDEFGIAQTRRFLCEWLSFTHRYIPVGILEYLPPKLNDRPPAWKGRDELEALLGSGDYKDWIKISEMFLGPADEEFNFIPKHKSNAY